MAGGFRVLSACLCLAGCVEEPSGRDGPLGRADAAFDEDDLSPDELEAGAALLPDFSTAPATHGRLPQDGLTATWLTPSTGLLSLIYDDYYWNYWIYTGQWGSHGRFSEIALDSGKPWVELDRLDGDLPWETESSIRAGWVNEDHGFFSIMASDRFWGMCMPGHEDSCGPAYSQSVAGRFDALPDDHYWKQLDRRSAGRWPFEGPGITAGWYDSRKGIFWIVSGDLIWGAYLDARYTDRPDWPNYFSGSIKTPVFQNPLRRIQSIDWPVRPWDGEGVTATWFNPINGILTVVSGNNYWSIATDDDDRVVEAGVLGQEPIYQAPAPESTGFRAFWCEMLANLVAINDMAKLGMFVGLQERTGTATAFIAYGADVVTDLYHHQLTISRYSAKGMTPFGDPPVSGSLSAYGGVAFNFDDSVADWYGTFLTADAGLSHPAIPFVNLTGSVFAGDDDGNGLPDLESVWGGSVGITGETPELPAPVVEDGSVSSGYWEPFNGPIRSLHDTLSATSPDVHLVDADTGETCPETWPDRGSQRRCIIEFGDDSQPHYRRLLAQWAAFCSAGACPRGFQDHFGIAMHGLAVALLRDAGESMDAWCGGG